VILQDTKSDGRFGGGSRFGNNHQGIGIIIQQCQQLMHVVFTNIVSCKKHLRGFLSFLQVGEIVCKSIVDSPCSQVRTSDPYDYQKFGIRFERSGSCFDITDLLLGYLCRKVQPAQKIIPGSPALIKGVLCLQSLLFKSLYFFLIYELINSRYIQFYLFHFYLLIRVTTGAKVSKKLVCNST